MKRTIRSFPVLAAGAAAATLALWTGAPHAAADEPQDTKGEATPPVAAAPADAGKSARGVVDVVMTDKRFSMLSDAIRAAGLTDTLRAAGPVTLFAPTDAAIEKLSQDERDSLMKPENKERLVAALKHHVIAGRFTRVELASLAEGSALKTLAGDTVAVTASGASVKVGGVSQVVQADIAAGSGVVHVLDAVLLPAGEPEASDETPAEEPLDDAARELLNRDPSKPELD
jgi:uncharacterized surface protein with fasciclin (FAS1) repeats